MPHPISPHFGFARGSPWQLQASAGLCCLLFSPSRIRFNSSTRLVNLSWSCSVAILAVNSRKRSACSISGFVSTGPFPGQLPNGQCSDSIDVFLQRRTQFHHDGWKCRIVRSDCLRTEFANVVFQATVGHTTDSYSPQTFPIQCLLYATSEEPYHESAMRRRSYPCKEPALSGPEGAGLPRTITHPPPVRQPPQNRWQASCRRS